LRALRSYAARTRRFGVLSLVNAGHRPKIDTVT